MLVFLLTDIKVSTQRFWLNRLKTDEIHAAGSSGTITWGEGFSPECIL
jgi:hypothetical protein